jgi:hypothetical protein
MQPEISFLAHAEPNIPVHLLTTFEPMADGIPTLRSLSVSEPRIFLQCKTIPWPSQSFPLSCSAANEPQNPCVKFRRAKLSRRGFLS